jgi:hypothetical protein
MLKIIALATAACLMSGCTPTVERHIVGVTEGDAHRKADAQCKALGERARVHMFLNNAIAFECFDPRTGAGEHPPGLTDGAL